jgi:hypothetical protein
MPTLSAVIEVQFGNSPGWLPAPPKKCPSFVHLNAAVSDEDIVLVFHTASLFNSAGTDGPCIALDDFLPESISAIPGGLVAQDGAIEIYPSCCCGFENWREWADLLSGTGSPWLGHDPSPIVEVTSEGFRVWPDGGLDAANKNIESSIFFARDQLISAISTVEGDLREFLIKTDKWCRNNFPGNATALMAAMSNLLAIQRS